MPRLARPDPEAQRFGAIVRRLRNERRWTLIEFGRAAKMNPTYLGFLERGENVPSLTVVLHLARVLGADAAAMIAEVAAKRT
jgi:transcriptional regulator with XRE-family HTH domain